MEREPDVELKVSLRAKEVRFESKPEVVVEAHADSPATAESQSERENLPDELEEGVTYPDFAVRWRVAARLNEPDWEEAVSGDRRTRRLPRNAPRLEDG
jgi:hypothetical protein